MVEWASIFSEVKIYAFLFAAVTLMAVASRGSSALKWSKDLKISALVNFGISKFNNLFGIVLLLPLLWVQEGYKALALPTLPPQLWDILPTPVTWLILLLAYDLVLYWVHRWLHNSWLWPMHAVHHSDEHLHFLSWSRAHALETAFIGSFMILGLTWMGLTVTDIAILAFIKAMHQYYVHSNIDWDHGPLKKIIASPQYHRWHHADIKSAYDKNFASIFPFYDIMFGTYHHPGTAKDVPTGFEGSPGNDFVALISYPFTQWYSMISERLAKSPDATAEQPGLGPDKTYLG